MPMAFMALKPIEETQSLGDEIDSNRLSITNLSPALHSNVNASQVKNFNIMSIQLSIPILSVLNHVALVETKKAETSSSRLLDINV